MVHIEVTGESERIWVGARGKRPRNEWPHGLTCRRGNFSQARLLQVESATWSPDLTRLAPPWTRLRPVMLQLPPFQTRCKRSNQPILPMQPERVVNGCFLSPDPDRGRTGKLHVGCGGQGGGSRAGALSMEEAHSGRQPGPKPCSLPHQCLGLPWSHLPPGSNFPSYSRTSPFPAAGSVCVSRIFRRPAPSCSSGLPLPPLGLGRDARGEAG